MSDETWTEKRFSCRVCEDRGHLFANRKSDWTVYIFRCICSAGKYARRNYPQWRDDMTKSYEISGAMNRAKPSSSSAAVGKPAAETKKADGGLWE